jgi:hypothetical protein
VAAYRLTHGRWRRWLGRRLGGDFDLGDRAWRRILHGLAAIVLFYYALPRQILLGLTREELLLTALGLVLVLELLRWLVGLELPTLRAYERRRVASYVFYAVALVAVVLLFPMPIALVVVPGTALIDPLVGELRLSTRWRDTYPWLPGAVYALLATTALVVVVRWSVLAALLFAGIAAAVALLAERPKIPELDDDLAMTLVPALVLAGLMVVFPAVFP